MGPQDIDTIRNHVQTVLDTTEKSVSRAVLFGSVARNEDREDSDVDIALIDTSFQDVAMYKRGRWFKKEWDYIGVGELELFCLTPTEYEERVEAGQSTATNIKKEGIDLLDPKE